MKKVLLLLIAIGMMATTSFGQIVLGQQTVTFMNCRECDDYFELQVVTLDMVGLLMSADTIDESIDSNGMCADFYSNFAAGNLPGVKSVFLRVDDEAVPFAVIRKDYNDETKAIYLSTIYGWLESVDMQDFRYFDRIRLLFEYPLEFERKILMEDLPLR